MQISIPNYKRPFYIKHQDLEEIINIPNILLKYHFCSSKSQGKLMVKNGEIWILKNNLDLQYWRNGLSGRGFYIPVEEEMQKYNEVTIATDEVLMILVGGNKYTALCHRIVINKLV